jgi:DNA-binding XRE family transcriptional regulator
VGGSGPSLRGKNAAGPLPRSPNQVAAPELRRRRELLGWSQAEAARRSGVSRTVINEIEAGRRMPHTGTYHAAGISSWRESNRLLIGRLRNYAADF